MIISGCENGNLIFWKFSEGKGSFRKIKTVDCKAYNLYFLGYDYNHDRLFAACEHHNENNIIKNIYRLVYDSKKNELNN